MKNILIISIVLLLSGCATPVTILKGKTGEVVNCGGGTAGSFGGLVGYAIQESHDKECVDAYKAQGYKVQ